MNLIVSWILKTSKQHQGCTTVTNYSMYFFFFFWDERYNLSGRCLKAHDLLQRSSMESFAKKSVKWKANLQHQIQNGPIFLGENLKIEQFHKPSKLQKIVFSKLMEHVIKISD